MCEVLNCKKEVFSSCHRCSILLCWDHFIEDTNLCSEHGTNTPTINNESLHEVRDINQKGIVQNVNTQGNVNIIENIIIRVGNSRECRHETVRPETFVVEGEDREGDVAKVGRSNKQTTAKKLRNEGKEYISPATKKLVPARFCASRRCDSEKCYRLGKLCGQIDAQDREKVFQHYYSLKDLTRQREFLVRHLKIKNTNRKTTGNRASRRKYTIQYFLTVNNNTVPVCKQFFLGTLSISERTCRTALCKVNEVGVLEAEKRGGRRRNEDSKIREKEIRISIEKHIERFPKMESHYCRANTTKLYLHPDLSLTKIYSMFIEELNLNGHSNLPSFSTYKRVFKNKGLSFHSPKKDQCSLCVAFWEGGEAEKEKLKDRFDEHIAEKTKVREKKEECKQLAKDNQSILCGVFDLQQVIYVPISNDSSIYYKRRLSTFNFTFYDVATKDCFCFVWHEAVSKRGSAEIATCISKVLEDYADKGIKQTYLFSDGCPGQNKNSVIASMLLYSVQRIVALETISLKFFESSHGQNEGDSAHSAICRAIRGAGDIFVPTQLHPVIKLARRQQPYTVISMNWKDFKDFKLYSKTLRILKVRTSDSGKNINWTNIREILVKKTDPCKIFFKTSHLQNEFDSISLKRLSNNIRNLQLRPLNTEPPKISKCKFQDLSSLCRGDTPVVRLPEFQNFFLTLSHEE